ncbi:MAG TPA: hypothetical protein VNS81_11745 [Nocardioides sp.]|nr:hypothetical protein [Nocardioides sp.]
MSGDPLGQSPEAPVEPDEPVDPALKPVPEQDGGTPEDYHVPEVDPEEPIAGAQADSDDDAYLHAEEVEEDRA